MGSKANTISLEICQHYFNFDEQGNLWWKNTSSKSHDFRICLNAGFINSRGYYSVMVEETTYLTHRILYQLYHNIELNSDQIIDHINRNKTDNRKENLRLDQCSQNNMNRKTHKNNLSSGYKNISIDKQGYRIRIMKNKKCEYSKRFPITTPIEEIIEFRNIELIRLNGEFACFA